MFFLSHFHVFCCGRTIKVGSFLVERSPTKPMNHPSRCYITSLSTTNFIGEWITIANALPGLTKRYVLKSWREFHLFLELLVFC